MYGKGGVGETTVAAGIAVALAHRGHDVHPTTTDPAAHLTEPLHGTVENVGVSRIDPAEATRAYRERVMVLTVTRFADEGFVGNDDAESGFHRLGDGLVGALTR